MNKILKDDSYVAVIPQYAVSDDTANLQLPNPYLAAYYNDIENRIYRIEGEVSSDLLELCRLIVMWNKEDEGIPIEERKPIRIVIFSPGGDLYTFRSLRAHIKLSKTPIIAINEGKCMSAGAYIYLSCPTRYALKGAKLLVHYGEISLANNGKDAVEQLKSYEKELEELVDVIQESSDFTREQIKNNLSQDWIIDDNVQVEHRMTDKIIDDISLLY